MSIVASSVSRDPFKSLFLEFLQSSDASDISSKTQLVQDFMRELEELDSNSENEANFLYWARVFAAFSAAAVVGSATTLNPILGIIASASAVSSATGIMGMSIKQHQERKTVLDKLKHYRFALSSKPALDWAILWEMFGLDVFFNSLYAASAGKWDNQHRLLVRNDGKNPMAAALDVCIQSCGGTREDLIKKLTKVKEGVSVRVPQERTTVPKVLAEAEPQMSQKDNCDTDFHQTALDILDGLVRDADKSVRAGCVILAAPGAGKTTFLGAAWGRLKADYGDRFKSLAVVVKACDVEAFKACSDAVYCVKDSPVKAAIAIIKFIHESQKDGNQVHRLFIDDFITSNQYFDSSLDGYLINPSNYELYMDRKEAKDAGDYDAIPLQKCLMASLNELWLVGREKNAALYVSSHSSNIESLPFLKGGSSSRSVGDFIFLAKDDKRDFIEFAFANASLVPSASKREELKNLLANSKSENREPWILSNFKNWVLGIVPDSVYEEYQGYRKEWESSSSPGDDIKAKLENMFKLEIGGSTSKETVVKDNPKLSETAQTILDIIKSGNPPVSFESIRKSRKWGDNKPTREDIRQGINDLISGEFIEGDNESGYNLI